jgi:hypothetical protein
MEDPEKGGKHGDRLTSPNALNPFESHGRRTVNYAAIRALYGH